MTIQDLELYANESGAFAGRFMINDIKLERGQTKVTRLNRGSKIDLIVELTATYSCSSYEPTYNTDYQFMDIYKQFFKDLLDRVSDNEKHLIGDVKYEFNISSFRR